jgi:glycosyltransferase involved in cell wall biosynthesis
MNGVTAVVFVGEHPDAFVPCIRSMARAHPDLPIVAGGEKDPKWEGVDFFPAHELAGLLRAVTRAIEGHHLVVVSEPALAPVGFLDPALAALDADLRLAAVSFLSNHAGHLSFPVRNVPTHHQVEDLDEQMITDRLRNLSPSLAVAAVAVPAGPITVLSRWALSANAAFHGSTRESFEDSTLTIAAWALDAQRRGFVCAVDPSTFVTRPYDLAPPAIDPLADPKGRHWINFHFPGCTARIDEERASAESPLALVHRTAAAKVRGLRIGIDGSCLGPKEMGTQVQTLALVDALCRRDDVTGVVVGLRGPVPDYARNVLSRSKITVHGSADLARDHVGELDVIHRPYQPDWSLPFDSWREAAARVVLTLQDLIAYQVGSYHPTSDTWLEYRRDIRAAAAGADGLVVISEDTHRYLAFEGVPVDPSNVFVVPNGTDHLTGAETALAPRELLDRGFLARQFLAVLGANYSHKNRDLAIEAWRLVRAEYPEMAIVLVGAAVPFGSSRRQESVLPEDVAGDNGVFVLPDVTSAERNWVLRHADVVLYPTSAEGFGLVPFEAARFGTPLVEVAFGPLEEVAPDLPVAAADWSPPAIAAATLALLGDPALGREQVEALLKAGGEYTWDRTAAGLVDAYRTLLSRPVRRVHATKGADL